MKFALFLFAANLVCSIGGVAMSIIVPDKSVGLSMSFFGAIFFYAACTVMSFNKPSWDGLAEVVGLWKLSKNWTPIRQEWTKNGL